MFETMNKMMLSGLGLLSVTQERAEEMFDELVRRGEMEKSQRGRFVKDLTGTAKQAREELEDMLAKHVRDALSRLDLPTREDLIRVEGKLDELLARRKGSQKSGGSK